MTNLEEILVELHDERSRIEKAIAALESITTSKAGNSASTGQRKWKMSAEARARIAAAQRARWAKVKAGAKKK